MEKYRLVRRDVLPIPGEEEQKKPQEENEVREQVTSPHPNSKV